MKKMPQNPPKNKIVILLAAIILISAQTVLHAYENRLLRKSPSCKDIPVKVLQKIDIPKGYHEGLSFNGPDLLLSNGEKGKVWALDKASGSVRSIIEPVSDFTESVSFFSGNQFFVTEWEDKKLYRATLDGNKLIPEVWISVKPAHPAGVVWTGNQLFMITWTRGMGTKFALLELDKDMGLLGVVSIQIIEEPTQLAWDGKYLWISSWYDSLVYKIDVKDWEVLGAFRSPVSKTTGIVWDGKSIWLTGTHSDLYKLEVGQ